MPLSERKKEIKRRRKRRAKYAHIKTKLGQLDSAGKEKLIGQLRRMTSGADDLIKQWGLG